jgi:DNA-binding SARP family transcriptional activator
MARSDGSGVITESVARGDDPRIVVCLLGSFRVLKDGKPVPLRRGGKSERLLGALALDPRGGIERDELMGIVWPSSDEPLAAQSLNTLVYSLHRSLGEALFGRPPVVREAGRYRLNTEAGVGVDIAQFDSAAAAGDRAERAGDQVLAIRWYVRAAAAYSGDLTIGSQVEHIVERERLRARYLSILARLADHQFAAGDYEATLVNALDVLAYDPCREDAHRMAMRCYVRVGERAQALRQYRLCRDVLAIEFDAVPEPETEALYDTVRLDPGSV